MSEIIGAPFSSAPLNAGFVGEPEVKSVVQVFNDGPRYL